MRVNLLSKLANTKKHDHNKTMIQETLTAPNTEKEEFNTINVTYTSNWMMHIMRYLTTNEIPPNEVKENMIKNIEAKYIVVT